MKPKTYQLIIGFLCGIIVILSLVLGSILINDKNKSAIPVVQNKMNTTIPSEISVEKYINIISAVQNKKTSTKTPGISEEETEDFLDSLPDQWPMIDYRNDDFGFKVKYPSNWNIQVNPKQMAQIALVSIYSPEETKDKNFWPQVNVSIENLSSNIKLNEYAQKRTKQKIEFGGVFKISKSEQVQLNGSSALMITGTFVNYPEIHKDIDTYVIKRNRAYIITYTTDQIDNDKNLYQAKKIMKSFKIE